MKPIHIVIVLALATPRLFAQSGSASPVDPPPDSPLRALADACSRGETDARFEAACRAVIEADVREHAEFSTLPDDFFRWIEGSKELRGDATLAIAAVGPKVAWNLQLLRAHDARLVERYSALAVAYAAAWSSGDHSIPCRYWVDGWLTRGRDVPEMVESFVYHVERRKDMRVPLRRAPWQVLAHLADSLVPITEREWALDRYRKRKTEGLRELFGAVPYTLDPKRGDAPCTLESFLEFGGACTHNVQFAGGVFDAFGIPSGWAGGPGHTYPYWFEMDGEEVSIHRTNEIGNRNGKIRDPLSDGHVWEDRLRLLVEALNHSRAGQRRAALAAWAYSRVDESDRASAAAILVTAVKANPYCHEALSALADATQARQLSLEAAGQAWKSVVRALADHPYDLPPLLERALPGAGDSSPTFAGDEALLKTLSRRWSKEGHDDLVAQAEIWRGRVLAARGKRAEAGRLLREIATKSADSHHERFARAVDALAGAYPGAPDSTERLGVLMELMLRVEQPDAAAWSELHRSRIHAVRTIVRELEALDRPEDAAAAWYAELANTRGGRDGTGSDPLFVGGGGGALFEVAPAGAELIGVRVATTGWNGRAVIGCIQGLFDRSGEEMIGERAGDRRSGEVDLRAPDGWRVAGLIAAGSDRLDGLQLVFVPRDAKDSRVRLSPWVGTHRQREQLIGGRDVRIIGIRGRAGADVDAVGLFGVPLD